MVSKINKKNWFREHWITSIFLGLFIIGIFGAIFGDDSSTSNLQATSINQAGENSQELQVSSQTQAKPYNIGDKIIIDDMEYIVNDLSTFPVVGSEYAFEEANGIFLVISLTIKNNGKNEIFLSGSDFKVTDSQDRNYKADTMAGIYLDGMGFNSFTFEKLGAGLSTSGEIVFDVPIDDIGLVLEISGEKLLSDTISVNLGI